MPKLKCGVDTCVYFYTNYCARSGISVKGETALTDNETKCSSYRKRDRVANDIYKFEIGSIGVSEYLSVNCDAVNCLYNRNLLCKAKEITIDGSRAKISEETFCSSFLLK